MSRELRLLPGCSLDGTAKDFHRSTLAVAAKLGLELPELEDWICCGSTAAHSSDPLLADALPAKTSAPPAAQTVAVACAACYSRLKMANHHIAGDAAVRAKVAHGGRGRLRRPDAGPASAGDSLAGTSAARGSPRPSAARWLG